jgi:hypothetical protein
MSEHTARVLLSLSRDARGQPFKMDEMRTEPVLTLATYGSARLDPGQDAGAPATARLLLESASPEARSLEGRPLAMHSSARLPDRSRLRLLDPWRRLAAAFGEQKRPMSGPKNAFEACRLEMIVSRHDDLSPSLARAGGGECGL